MGESVAFEFLCPSVWGVLTLFHRVHRSRLTRLCVVSFCLPDVFFATTHRDSSTGWLNPTRSYVPPVQIGAAMRAGAVGRIALLPKDVGKSSLQVGDWVIGTMSWGEYAKVPLKELQKIQ